MPFSNCYDDTTRAEAYAGLEFANTYYLAFRDLPTILGKHVCGSRAIDFGCGAGRSTRFLKQCGFDVIGVDIASAMIAKARLADPSGDYRLIGEGDFSNLERATFDLVVSAFTFDNIPGWGKKIKLLRGLAQLLRPEGTIVSIVSSPEIYTHEWASFSTKEYRENATAKSGDVVRITTTDFADRRPAEDILWTDAEYLEVYRRADVDLIARYKPLATGNEPFPWVNETTIAPWVIYVLTPAVRGPNG